MKSVPSPNCPGTNNYQNIILFYLQSTVLNESIIVTTKEDDVAADDDKEADDVIIINESMELSQDNREVKESTRSFDNAEKRIKRGLPRLRIRRG